MQTGLHLLGTVDTLSQAPEGSAGTSAASSLTSKATQTLASIAPLISIILYSRCADAAQIVSCTAAI